MTPTLLMMETEGLVASWEGMLTVEEEREVREYLF